MSLLFFNPYVIQSGPQKWPPINIPVASWAGTAPTFTYTVSGQSYGNGLYTITSSPLAISTYNVRQLFDGVVTDVGISYYYTSTPNFIQIQLPTTMVLKSYRLFPLNTFYATPTAWNIQGSTDGSTFTTIDTRTASSFQSAYTTGVLFTLTGNTTPYSYYRMNMTSPTTGNLYIKQWQLFS